MTGKRWILLLSVLILVALVVLASSLHDVRFQPGKPVSFDNDTPTSVPTLNVMETVQATPLWKILLFWVAFAINVILFFWLLPPEVRKRMLRQMLSLILGALALVLALRYRLVDLPFLHSQPVEPANAASSGAGGNSPLPTFTPPHMALWWVFLISFLVLGVVLVLLWLAYRWWIRSGARRSSQLDAIRDIAKSSLGDLAAGRDWSDVIIQSYARMNAAVHASRGLQRNMAATPREFAERLEQTGLPAHAIDRLTRLFESARYGARGSTQADINEAVACLNSILQACGQAQ